MATQGDPGRVSPTILARYAVRETMGTVIAGVALFWAAGTVSWVMGWVVFGIYVAWVAGMAAVLVVLEPELIAERLGPRRGSKDWDLAILGVLAMANLARLIVAGLDHRFAWTPASAFPLPLMAGAAVLAAAGYAVFVWATASNAFFSQQVRLQEERGQSVATGGPYRFVRHPGYAGAILYNLATPLLLVLIAVESTDLLFAVDSIPAVFAVTNNPFIVYTSNVFAILGLRSMYFLLAGVVEKFQYLRLGLAIVLTFIGLKMLVVALGVHIPIWISLVFVAVVLLGSVVASLLFAKESDATIHVDLPPDFDLPLMEESPEDAEETRVEANQESAPPVMMATPRNTITTLFMENRVADPDAALFSRISGLALRT